MKYADIPRCGEDQAIIEDWETVDFIPYQGLENVYDAGEGQQFRSVCPGFLKEECRGYELVERGKNGVAMRTIKSVELDPPYEVRFVAAEITDGELWNASAPKNYIETERSI